MIHLEFDDSIAVIRIDRPERRNALNLEAVEALDAAVTSLGDTTRAAVICGTDGHFCAGADLTELEDLTFTHRLRVMLDHLVDLPIPTIAAISGSCMGLGMQLAVACDIRIATDDARFAVPVAKLGLMVDHWTLRRLVALFGHGAARHMVLSAAVLDAADGHRLGFIQELGSLDAAIVTARRIASLAPLSIAGSKLGLNLLDPPVDTAAYEAAFEAAWRSADLEEGRRAFAERRSPRFSGR